MQTASSEIALRPYFVMDGCHFLGILHLRRCLSRLRLPKTDDGQYFKAAALTRPGLASGWAGRLCERGWSRCRIGARITVHAFPHLPKPLFASLHLQEHFYAFLHFIVYVIAREIHVRRRSLHQISDEI